MLTAGGQAAYISEPLNVLHRPGVFAAPVDHWYTYICTENEAEYLPALRQTLAFHYHAWEEIKSLRSRKDALRMGRDWTTFMGGGLGHKRPLLKDPFAVFSAPWFAERLGCQVVITVRHPAAFASSLKRLDWPFEFSNFLQQPLLMQHLLESSRAEIEAISPGDLIGQASLLWKIIYHVAADYSCQHPEFITVRHEDLSLDPLDGFRALYSALDLTYSSKAREAVLKSSSPANPQELPQGSVHAYQLNSQANITNWKSRLEPEEIERIARITGETATHFYPEFEWG